MAGDDGDNRPANPNARARLIAKFNPVKLRAGAIKILEHPNPHPNNVKLATEALRLAKFADGGKADRVTASDGTPSPMDNPTTSGQQ